MNVTSKTDFSIFFHPMWNGLPKFMISLSNSEMVEHARPNRRSRKGDNVSSKKTSSKHSSLDCEKSTWGTVSKGIQKPEWYFEWAGSKQTWDPLSKDKVTSGCSASRSLVWILLQSPGPKWLDNAQFRRNSLESETSHEVSLWCNVEWRMFWSCKFPLCTGWMGKDATSISRHRE